MIEKPFLFSISKIGLFLIIPAEFALSKKVYTFAVAAILMNNKFITMVFLVNLNKFATGDYLIDRLTGKQSKL